MSCDLPAALAALPGFPQLRGLRVRLRGPCPGDADAIFALFSDPAVMRYWSRRPMVRRDEATASIAEAEQAFAARDRIGWVIVDKGDAVIGSCALFCFDARHRRAELGYALRSDHWGKGLAREAASAVLDWAFRTLSLHCIGADIDPRNERSRRILRRLGFTREGLVREEAGSMERFALLARDWHGRSS
jgi:ribosomal-protein-alanine N-acetyltransferase